MTLLPAPRHGEATSPRASPPMKRLLAIAVPLILAGCSDPPKHDTSPFYLAPPVANRSSSPSTDRGIRGSAGSMGQRGGGPTMGGGGGL